MSAGVGVGVAGATISGGPGRITLFAAAVVGGYGRKVGLGIAAVFSRSRGGRYGGSERSFSRGIYCYVRSDSRSRGLYAEASYSGRRPESRSRSRRGQ